MTVKTSSPRIWHTSKSVRLLFHVYSVFIVLLMTISQCLLAVSAPQSNRRPAWIAKMHLMRYFIFSFKTDQMRLLIASTITVISLIPALEPIGCYGAR